MSLSTADKWGIGIGGVVLAGVAYEIWRNSQGVGGPLIRDFSANNGQVISGYGYNAVVNLANGYDTTVNGVHYFLFGTYHQGGKTFTPTGHVFVFPHGSTAGYYTTTQALAAQGVTFG